MGKEDRFLRKIRKRVGWAIKEFNLIENQDRIMVAVSGGKDSFSLLYVLMELQKRAPVKFELVPANLDQGFEGYRQDIVEEGFKKLGFKSYILKRFDIYTIVSSKSKDGSTFCALCSRLRRGILYSMAMESGCNKLALGHHLDDFLHTFFLNLIFAGRLKAMSPNFLADNRRIRVIRPLVFVKEEELAIYAKKAELPVVCCGCPVCGKRDLKRQKMKDIIHSLEREFPGVREVMIRALSRVELRYLPMNVRFEKDKIFKSEFFPSTGQDRVVMK